MRLRLPYQILVASFCCFALLLAPLRASYAQADARMKEVKKACAAGDVDRAIGLLAEIYAETNDATAIYNQARCYQGNGQPERAASRFREYLRKANDLSPADRAEVEAFIKEADAEVEARARAAAAPAPVALPPPVPQPTAPPGPPPYYYGQPQPTPPPPAPPVRTSRRKGLMIAGFITLGVSYLLTAVAGGVLVADETTKDCTNCKAVGEAFYIPILGPWIARGDAEKNGDSKRTDLDALAVTAGVAQAIGGALTTVGLILFATSGGKPAPARAGDVRVGGVAILPTRGGAVGQLSATF